VYVGVTVFRKVVVDMVLHQELGSTAAVGCEIDLMADFRPDNLSRLRFYPTRLVLCGRFNYYRNIKLLFSINICI
jgi:hypothetical protein